MNKDMGKHVKNICTVIGGVLLCALFLMGSKKGLFTSRENLKIFLNQFGLLAPLIFMLIQILQVIFPIIPGALGCAAGIVIWGPGWGFLFNYISICIGSTFNFIIAKKYGKPIIDKLFSLKQIKKYEKKLNNGNGFQTVFAVLIFMPVAPDDLLCYLAGTTEMKLSTFLSIIVLGKPMSIFLYSVGLTAVLRFFL